MNYTNEIWEAAEFLTEWKSDKLTYKLLSVPRDAIDEGSEERAKLIHNTTKDLAVKFLYYNRKEDEELPVGAIEEAIKSGETSVAEIVSVFEKALRENL